MSFQRFRHETGHESATRPDPIALAANGFVAFPAVLLPSLCVGNWQWQVYQRALAEARAVVRPSIIERLQPATWN
jgi:hypothetical protein